MDVRLELRQEASGRWRAQSERPPVSVTAATREECLRRARRAAVRALPRGRGPTVIVAETLPRLVGVAEAAEVLGWDKRRVVTYVDRGAFPSPLQGLAGGRIWALDDVRAFARAFRERQRARTRKARRPARRPAP